MFFIVIKIKTRFIQDKGYYKGLIDLMFYNIGNWLNYYFK